MIRERAGLRRISTGRSQVFAVLVAVSILTLSMSGCGNSGGTGSSTSEIRIQGAGATFPNPIYQKWFSEYNKVNPGVKFDYQSIDHDLRLLLAHGRLRWKRRANEGR